MKVLGILLLISVAVAKHEKYSGWKSYYVTPSTESQLRALGEIRTYLELDFFSSPGVDHPGVVLVKPEYQEIFIKFLEQKNINHSVHSVDVKSSLDVDDMLIEETRIESRSNGAKIPYDNYQPLEVIYEYLDMIAERYPNVATLVTPTNSFEGRPIKYLKISNNNFQGNKPVIIIEAAMIAREWISPPTVTYAIHKLVENVTEPELLEDFDWILLPVANPDGYKYTFDEDRMWIKTRSLYQHIASIRCPGVNGNLNFDIAWNKKGVVYDNPCSDFYAGGRPMSEIEVKVVGDIIKEHLDNTILYLSMHSFGSLILFPWSHNATLPNNALALQVVGVGMAEAIDKVKLPQFVKYRVGNSFATTGTASSGCAQDYAYSLGVPLSYKYELPGLKSGLEGFHLNPKYIKQVSEETWIGIVAGVKRSAAINKK